MPLPRARTKIPQEIRDISVELFDGFNEDGTRKRGARYSVQVRFDDGSLKVLTGDLVEHLTQAQINTLVNFMNNMRTKAQEEVLPA